MAQKTKATLEAEKAKAGKAWAADKQEQLTELTMFLVDAEEILETWNDTEGSAYKIPAGSEMCVHLKIFKGTKRFDPLTGKEIRKPNVQTFSYAEWQLFKKNFVGLGYSIIEVLHDPYNEAAAFVAKA